MAIKSSKSGVKKGDVIHDRYEIMSLIGEGGMSRVFLASDRNLANKLWAVKEVDRKATDPAGRPIEAALSMEADLLSKIDHPNIVDIVDIKKTENFIYVVMDYVEGQSLDRIVRAEGPQSEEDVQRWMLQICDALDYLHCKNPPIIYRDMKPNNIMRHPDGYVKLIDFGVSREYKDDEKKDTISFGTPGYAAPEQYGKAQSDARTDIYCMGATMWHLLGGEAPPMTSEPLDVHSVNPKVGEGFAKIIKKCTEPDRSDRYQNCSELAADLEVYEELTEDFHNAQLRKVITFVITGILAVLLALLGSGLFVKHNADINDTFDSHIDRANKALSSAEADMNRNSVDGYYQTALDEFISAIDTKPVALEAWNGLIDTYELDADFDTTEKKQFDSLYDKYQSDLQNSSISADLSYEIGRMYWYFYSYGQDSNAQSKDDLFQNSASNQTARIKASRDYFRAAANAEGFKDKNTALIYAEIADFVSDLEREVTQGGETQEMYETYFNNLCDLLSLTQDEDVEIARYNTYLLIANSLENYTNRFSTAESIKREDVVNLWNDVLKSVNAETNLSSSTADIRQSILNKRDSINSKIEAAFSKNTFSGSANDSYSGSE